MVLENVAVEPRARVSFTHKAERARVCVKQLVWCKCHQSNNLLHIRQADARVYVAGSVFFRGQTSP